VPRISLLALFELHNKAMGYVYLVHLEKPLPGGRHYVGYTSDLEKRVALHRSGEGAKFLKQANEAGIGWVVVRVWMNADTDKEKSIKSMSARIICPVCKAKAAEIARQKKLLQVSRSDPSVHKPLEAA
jgi:predicted GIY-YIG superfamily endonuclease